MAMYLNDMKEKRPGDPDRIQAFEQEMRTQMKAYRLRELRKQAGLTQTDVARRIGVSQRQISKIENGSIENSRVSTIGKYVEAIGGELSLNLFRVKRQNVCLKSLISSI